MRYTWTPASSILSLHFIFHFLLKTSPSFFLTEVNQPLSGQISDEIWYTWCHVTTTIYQDNHNQNQINSTTINQTYIYFSPCPSLIYLLSLDPFVPFLPFYIRQYFIYFLNW